MLTELVLCRIHMFLDSQSLSIDKGGPGRFISIPRKGGKESFPLKLGQGGLSEAFILGESFGFSVNWLDK